MPLHCRSPISEIVPGTPKNTSIPQKTRILTGREQSGGMNRPAIKNVSVRSPLLDCEQSIEPERIADSDNVARGVVIKPESDVEIDLLCWTQTI
jgi:hypothetical protein